MPHSDSPLDNSDNLYEVYFEVADSTACLGALEQSGVSTANATSQAHGFQLTMANQAIPEILKVLVAANQSVYQVRRTPLAPEFCYTI